MIHPSSVEDGPEHNQERPPHRSGKHARHFKKASINRGLINWSTFSLNDPEVFKLYQSCQRSYFDFPSMIPLLVVAYGTTITRLSLDNVGAGSPLFSASFAFFVLDTLLFSSYVLSRVIIKYTPKPYQQHRSYEICERLLVFSHKWRIEDIIAIMSTLMGAFNLLGRVWNGQCDDVANIWTSQRCNPFADLGSLPLDQVFLLYLIPLMCQSVFRGVAVEGLILCWILNLIFVIIASAYVGGWLQIWTIFYSIIFINISVVMERLMRLTFVQSQEMVDIANLRGRHELQLLEVSAEIERNHKEKEIFQLRNLMGNVAHDLKTPLHSIEADLEVLSALLSEFPLEAHKKASSKFKNNSQGVSVDSQSIFDSLNATCKLMAMAINRSQDFMKATNNIALVPVMETFDPASAVETSVSWMNHLQSGRVIKIHPMDPHISRHVVSDKQWLTENVLCLLSNAMKYSDGGVIDVKLQFVNCHTDVLAPNDRAHIDSYVLNMDSCCETKHCIASTRSPIRTLDCTLGSVATAVRSSDEMRQSLMVTIEDTGIGVAEEARQQLFQPSDQSQRRFGGTGIGLFCLTKRIEALGGSNGIATRTDGRQGSVFWFTFPYRTDDPPKTACNSDASNTDRTSSGHMKPLNILVIDDSLSVLKVTSRLLVMNGHNVTTAANGAIGLNLLMDAFTTQDFDTVLTDIQMPVMGGIEGTRRYREFEVEETRQERRHDGHNPRRKKLTIVGMSATTDIICMQEGLNAGMDYFVSKPFSYKDLQPILLDSSR